MQKVYTITWRLRFFLLVFYILLCAPFTKSLGQGIAAQQETSLSSAPIQSSNPATTVTQPLFPGGSDSLQRYLFLHIKAPDSLWTRDISGNIYFSFFVEANGKIDKIKIENGPASPGWDSAAIACIRKMPYWIPGRIDDKPATMHCFLPVYIPPGHQLYDLPDSVQIR